MTKQERQPLPKESDDLRALIARVRRETAGYTDQITARLKEFQETHKDTWTDILLFDPKDPASYQILVTAYLNPDLPSKQVKPACNILKKYLWNMCQEKHLHMYNPEVAEELIFRCLIQKVFK